MKQSPGCLDENRETMLQATLPVRRAAFQALLPGSPVPFEEVSSAAGLPVEAARQAAREVASVGMAEIMDGAVIGIDGLTTRPTQHSLILGGVELWTWCAYDIVGIAAALKTTAEGRTQCGACGQTIEVGIREGNPHETSVVGWLPSESCSNVMAEFCPSALFFCSSAHLDDWRAASGRAQGEALNLPALAERGREEWRQLVS